MQDKGSLIPLYERVRRTVRAGIESGQWSAGSFLPPEPELCRMLAVSRITLRRAIGELCDEGLVARQQGRGTLVLPRRMRQTLISLSGFSETMDGLGRQAGHRILAHDDRPADADVALRLAARAPARFDRILEADGRPLTLERLWFDAARFPAVVAQVAAGGSFFGALRERAGVTPAGAERQIDVGFASAPEAAALAIAATQPVYRIEKVVLDGDGRPLALSRLVTPCHLVTFTVKN